MAKNPVCRASFLRNHTSYDCHLWYTSVKWWYLQSFFRFFKILIFHVDRGKKAKKVQNKKFSLSCSLSQEQYSVWSSFVVHKCKMIIPPVMFFIFSKFLLFRLLGWSKGKKWPKMTKNPVCRALYSGTANYMIFIWTHV